MSEGASWKLAVGAGQVSLSASALSSSPAPCPASWAGTARTNIIDDSATRITSASFACAALAPPPVPSLPLPCRLLSSPRGLLLLFMLFWWLSQWFTKRQG